MIDDGNHINDTTDNIYWAFMCQWQQKVFYVHFCQNFFKTTLCRMYYFSFHFRDEETEI